MTRTLSILKQKPKIKKAMWSRRAQEYDQKINSGDIKQLSEVVRDLFRKDDQTEQSIVKGKCSRLPLNVTLESLQYLLI